MGGKFNLHCFNARLKPFVNARNGLQPAQQSGPEKS